ncbi:MAG: DUF3089 domain-containing protein [Cyclobacteriaceae bacterium]
MKKLLLLFSVFPFFLSAQTDKVYKGKYGTDDLDKVPAPPNYDSMQYWIAHPDQEDFADLVPGKGELMEYQETADVDVFFIYPTIYTKKQHKDHPWFADVNDKRLNKKIAKSTIKYQASVFNASSKVYAPLYRQSHIGVFYGDLGLKVDALQFSYRDVRRAFKHYLDNYNNGRPIIIASHSQGTMHAVSLIREFFDNQPLQEQLVAAYLVGMPLRVGSFDKIPPCEDENGIGCWMSWNTYRKGYYPPNHDYWYDGVLSTNPLSWKRDSTYVSWGANKGGILKNFRKIRAGLSDAQNADNMLWINRPKFFGNFLLNWNRFHIVDYNLFYMNIRENIERRVENYLKEQEG